MFKKSVIVKSVVDISATCVIGLGVLLFFLVGVPYHRGFYCEDTSIRYPYHESTISNTILYIFGISIPVVIILGVEWAIVRGPPRLIDATNLRDNARTGAKTVRRFFECAYTNVGYFLFGAASSQFITDVAKYSIGRLRPHFWAVCQPNVDCDSKKPWEYITDYRCTGTDDFRNRESRLSFVSGHSSFSAYSMLFAAIYLQYRWPFKTPAMIRPFVQIILLSMSWYTSLSRVSDYKHHPTDVLAGAIVGVTTALVTTLVIADRFSVRSGADDVGDQGTNKNPGGNGVELAAP